MFTFKKKLKSLANVRHCLKTLLLVFLANTVFKTILQRHVIELQVSLYVVVKNGLFIYELKTNAATLNTVFLFSLQLIKTF